MDAAERLRATRKWLEARRETSRARLMTAAADSTDPNVRAAFAAFTEDVEVLCQMMNQQKDPDDT